MTILANRVAAGADLDGMLLEDYLDAHDFLEATGRTVPRDKWVDDFAAEAGRHSFLSLE